MDDRAQSIGILHLFLGMIVGVIMIWIVNAVTAPLFELAAEQGTDPVATTGTSYLQEGVNFLPIMFLMIGFFGLIAYSVFSREVLR